MSEHEYCWEHDQPLDWCHHPQRHAPPEDCTRCGGNLLWLLNQGCPLGGQSIWCLLREANCQHGCNGSPCNADACTFTCHEDPDAPLDL